MPKIQVVIGETIDRVLTQMKERHLRGTSKSEVASSILDEWIWHNDRQLTARGINLRAAKVTRRKTK